MVSLTSQIGAAMSRIVIMIWSILFVQGFSISPCMLPFFSSRGLSSTKTTVRLALRKNVEIPLLEFQNTVDSDNSIERSNQSMDLTPLPSSNFPDQLATPFLYGLQIDTPLHKMVLEEAAALATTSAAATTTSSLERQRPMYGQLVWKDSSSCSLIGAIGCTAEILLNAPTRLAFQNDPQVSMEIENSSAVEKSEEFTSRQSSLNESPPRTILCRGGYRFVVKQVVKTIPFPVVIVDEIEDDADVDDSDMFFSVTSKTDSSIYEEDDEDDDNGDAELSHVQPAELIRRVMLGVQNLISSRLDDAIAKNNLTPLEKSILEDSGLDSGEVAGMSSTVIELAHAEEMAAVWEVFQHSLVDDIETKDRRFSIAIMAAELADMSNEIRRRILLTRNSEDRLRIVLRELNEIEGMAKAKRIASKITDNVDELDKDLKVGKPQLPKWALQITKGTRIEYFWNEEFSWCKGVVIEDPVKIVDEILLTIRFQDGEVHKLPLVADEKVRWRPV